MAGPAAGAKRSGANEGMTMGHSLLAVAMLLVYGPLALIMVLYAAALVMKLGGRPDFLRQLVERTKPPQPIQRKGDQHH